MRSARPRARARAQLLIGHRAAPRARGATATDRTRAGRPMMRTTLLACVRLLLLCCRFFGLAIVYPTNGSWYTCPAGQIWLDSQCPNVGIPGLHTLLECEARCASTSRCTAFNMNVKDGCVLRGCTVGAVPTTISAGWTGWASYPIRDCPASPNPSPAPPGPGPGPGMSDTISPLPPMGWMSWERFGCTTNCTRDPDTCVSERLFREMTDRLVDDGYLAAGCAH